MSKALPYKHFSNADAVLVALYERETRALSAEILGAVARHEGGDAKMRAAVRTYFAVVEDRGALLGLLAGGGSPVPDLVPQGRQVSQLSSRLWSARTTCAAGGHSSLRA